jgi:hypothetical protein
MVSQEVQLEVPLNDAMIDLHWIQKWASGCDQIDTELQTILMDKTDSFEPAKHVPTLKRLVDNLVFQAPVPVDEAAQDRMTADEFVFLMKQIEYDTQVFLNWEKKCSTVYGARYFKEQEHKLSVMKVRIDAATLFLDSCVQLVTWTNEADVIGECMQFKRKIQTKIGASMDDLVNIPILNCSAPCMLPAQYASGQVGVLTWALNDNLRSCAIALMPVFTYSKGKLHLEEQKLITQLARGNHNLDYQFSVLFKDQVDHRDERPMVYPGRFVFPSPVAPSRNPFFSCDLRRHRRTPEVKQLASKSMKIVEELAMRFGKTFSILCKPT